MVIGLAGEASVAWSPDGGFTLGDTDYTLVELGRPRHRPHRPRDGAGPLAIYKSRDQVEAFVDVVSAFPRSRVVELGIKAGGSMALLAQLLHPAKLVAVDIAPGPVWILERFLDLHDLRDSVRPYYEVDQADRQRLASIVAEEFADEAIDLVIDDASHLPEPTQASFEVLFPRLRTNGLFMIEDWSWEHAIANKLVLALNPESPNARMPTLDLLRAFEGIGVGREMLEPLRCGQFLSDLVSRVIVKKAAGDATIGDVTIRPFNVEIRRGPAREASADESVTGPTTPNAALRALHVGRLDRRSASQLAGLGARQVVVVDDEPPEDHGRDGLETTHVDRDLAVDGSVDLAVELGHAAFDVVVDRSSPNADRARVLLSGLLPQVRPGGIYMLTDWRHLVADQSGHQDHDLRRRMPPLFLELVLAVAEWNGTIDELRFGDGCLTIRRGTQDLTPDRFDVRHLYRDHFGSLLRP
jgi:predicted O-methyltransferase YrrM